MPTYWTTAQPISAGEQFASRHYRSFARAHNDRLRSTRGSGAYRVAMATFNLFRQVRLPDASGTTFPTQGEFFELYQHLDPENGTGQWPLSSPSDAEGANLANPLMQFVFGNQETLAQEDERLGAGSFPLWLGSSAPETKADAWQLGKLQRGVVDVSTGLQNVPALEAAQSWFRVTTDPYSPMGKAWGGYFPSPVILVPDCGQDDSDGKGIPSRQIFFTALRAGVPTSGLHGSITTNADGMAVCTYIGSCPEWTADAADGHVQFVAKYPLAYYVGVLSAGSIAIDAFPAEDWIEGPYTGQGVLMREESGMLNRAVWQATAEFRGTDSQRPQSGFKIREIAFAFQEFLTQQYVLAPAFGVASGGEIEAIYPNGSISGPAESGGVVVALFSAGASGSACGIYVTAAAILGRATVVVKRNGVPVATITLLPDASGSASEIHWWNGEPGGDIEVVLAEPLVAGTISAEVANLLAMKPDYWDAYLVARLSATQGGDQFGTGVDGSGRVYAFARSITDRLRTYGCVWNQGAAGPRTIAEWVSDNPTYDAVRRLSRQFMRIARRQHLIDYSISGGKSVIRMSRWAYGLHNDQADLFRGIAPNPSPIASGELTIGRTYDAVGTSGSIECGTFHTPVGSTFTAASTTYRATGDAKVYEHDGIIGQNPKQGWSNEWLVFLQTHVYRDPDDSRWKPAAYGDYYTWCNRCLFAPGYGGTSAFNHHINYNTPTSVDARLDGSGYDLARLSDRVMSEYVTPEAPDAYNFAEGANANPYISANFYKSCQIMRAPYEIESCTSDHAGASEVVTITLKSRMQSVPGADATFGTDPASWTAGQLTALDGEAYRTDDNAIRDYVASLHRGTPCKWRTGDAGSGSGITGAADSPNGSCLPHFVFVRLLPEPRKDDNLSSDPQDCIMKAEDLTIAEWYQRAMCEGYVDGITSARITCETGTGSLYDYTWDNLNYAAHGRKWVSPLSESARPDVPSGHGILPNTDISHAVFNRLVANINAMTKVRVLVPWSAECRTVTYYNSAPATQTWGDACSASGTIAATYAGNFPIASSVIADSGWVTCGGASLTVRTSTGMYACDGASYGIGTVREVGSFRVVIPAAFYDALPQDVIDDLELATGCMCKITRDTAVPFEIPVATFGEASACGVVAHGYAYLGTYRQVGANTTSSEECTAISNQTFDPGVTGPGGTLSFCRDTVPNEGGFVSSTTIGVQLLTEAGWWVESQLVAMTELD